MPVIEAFHLYLLALPLLLLDWQVAIIWGLSLSNTVLLSQLQALTYQGFEVWIVFLAVGFLRRWIFK